MKSIFLVFYFLFSLSIYADYVTTNSRVSAYYDEDKNHIRDLRGDLFLSVDISKIEFFLVNKTSADKKILNLKDFVVSKYNIAGTNIIRINYVLNKEKLTVDLIPSMIDKDSFKILFDFSNMKLTESTSLFVEIEPSQDKGKVIFAGNDSYINKNVYIKSSPTVGNLYVTRDDNIHSLVFLEVSDNVEKYRHDRLYYAVDNIEANKKCLVEIKFYSDVRKKNNVEKLLENELAYWNWYNKLFSYVGDKKVLEHFRAVDLLTDRLVIPSAVLPNKSTENPVTKLKLLHIKKLYGVIFSKDRFLEDINLKMTNFELVKYLNLVFDIVQTTNVNINKSIYYKNIHNSLLILINNIENNGELKDEEDSIETYMQYLKLIEHMIVSKEFEDKKDLLEIKRNKLKNYIFKNYVRKNGIKNRLIDSNINPKNIKYADIYDYDTARSKLSYFYNNSAKKSLFTNKNTREIDIKFNLELALMLYKYNLRTEANSILKSIETLYEKDGVYINDVYNNKTKISPAIYGDILYLYLLSNLYRENVL